MNAAEDKRSTTVVKFAFLAAVVALIGLGDAVYLTVHHYTGEDIPCSVSGGCGAVLKSAYATLFDIPIAIFGALAYFAAFSLAILTAFGRRALWNLFGAQVALMAGVSAWLIYLQAFVILEYCQYCLVSAGVCFTLFILFLLSKFFSK